MVDIERMIAEYLQEQLDRHPSMEPGDVMKLCFQASFGAEHLLRDKDAAWKYLLAEYDAADVSETKAERNDEMPEEKGIVVGEEKSACEDLEPLYENISDTLCRVNLRSWKASELPLEWLFTMFVKGAEEAAETRSMEHVAKDGSGAKRTVRTEGKMPLMFSDTLQIAETLIAEGVFPFSIKDWKQYLAEYPLENPVAVHHSEKYREREKPAYRLIPRRYIRLFPILKALCNAGIGAMNGRDEIGTQAYIIAIDGRCASGKTTMADMLAEITGAGVIHTDDFFLPMELRTAERMNEPGGNVHYERILEEVIPNLAKADAFSYGRFDCSQMTISGERNIVAGKLKIVEGAYSCHPQLGNYMNLRVFNDVKSEEQLARICRRDGENAVKSYRERWIPMEEKYLEAYQVKDKANIVL